MLKYYAKIIQKWINNCSTRISPSTIPKILYRFRGKTKNPFILFDNTEMDNIWLKHSWCLPRSSDWDLIFLIVPLNFKFSKLAWLKSVGGYCRLLILFTCTHIWKVCIQAWQHGQTMKWNYQSSVATTNSECYADKTTRFHISAAGCSYLESCSQMLIVE